MNLTKYSICYCTILRYCNILITIMPIELRLHDQEIYISHDQILILEPVTEDDYWNLSTEDLKVEYGQGVLYIHSSVSPTHENIFGFLMYYFRRYFEETSEGQVLGSRLALKLPNGHRP